MRAVVSVYVLFVTFSAKEYVLSRGVADNSLLNCSTQMIDFESHLLLTTILAHLSIFQSSNAGSFPQMTSTPDQSHDLLIRPSVSLSTKRHSRWTCVRILFPQTPQVPRFLPLLTASSSSRPTPCCGSRTTSSEK